ncbi:MAG TPA: AAA family ATPase [Candidatus Norongarragalinales archaeon]|nr:AAA family ATPase [Candidatus Norongarragalinales archaeon]
MIVGLVGQNCSGKDTAADYFVSKKGFEYYSLSDYLREELEKEGKPVTRENLGELGNALRAKFGNGILGEKALEHFRQGKNYIVVSIRHPEEAKALMTRTDFVLVRLDAPAQARFERMKARNREEDPKTFEEFLHLEKIENEGGSGRAIKETMDMAEYSIDASGSMDEERTEVGKLCLKLNIT